MYCLHYSYLHGFWSFAISWRTVIIFFSKGRQVIHTNKLSLCRPFVTVRCVDHNVPFFCSASTIFRFLARSRCFATHSLDTSHSVGLLWTSDQLDADISTWQHTTSSKRRTATYPRGILTHNPCKKRQQIHTLGRAAIGIGRYYIYNIFYLRKLLKRYNFVLEWIHTFTIKVVGKINILLLMLFLIHILSSIWQFILVINYYVMRCNNFTIVWERQYRWPLLGSWVLIPLREPVFVSCVCVLYRWRPLRLANPSFSRVLPCVCLIVLSTDLKNEAV